MKDYAMFTPEGNALVHRIVLAGEALTKFDPVDQVWNWALGELDQLSKLEGFEEATDTAVREAVWEAIV